MVERSAPKSYRNDIQWEDGRLLTGNHEEAKNEKLQRDNLTAVPMEIQVQEKKNNNSSEPLLDKTSPEICQLPAHKKQAQDKIKKLLYYNISSYNR